MNAFAPRIAIFFFLGMVLQMCSSCCENVDIYIDFTKLDAIPYNNEGAEAVDMNAGDTVKAIAFRLDSRLEKEYEQQAMRWNLATGAYAFSCPDNFIPRHEITGVTISSTADFDSEHPAGTSLNEYFVSESGDELTWGPEGITGINLLMSAPDELRGHQFIVRVDFEGDLFLADTTATIYLEP